MNAPTELAVESKPALEELEPRVGRSVASLSFGPASVTDVQVIEPPPNGAAPLETKSADYTLDEHRLLRPEEDVKAVEAIEAVEAVGTEPIVEPAVVLLQSVAPVDVEPLPHRLLRPGDVDRICSQEHSKGGLVAGLIARRSVSVLIGDSGIGKSPLAYQLGLCVAKGIPFLGMETQGGIVVYADYENGLEESQALRARLVKFLGLPKAPDKFLIWTPDCGSSLDLEGICRDVKPTLFIVDSLRSHDPAFEKSDNAGRGMGALRSAAYKHGVAILVIHHVRKPGPDGVPPLDSDETVLMGWLNQASGHRSIINQSDTRIGAELPNRAHDHAAMVLRWQRRLRGEHGPLYVERVSDEEDGEPIGYKPLVGTELLGNAEQEAAFGRLPQKFTFKEAKQVYERSDDPTRKWLLKCEAQGLVKQVAKRGHYQRLVF